MNKVNLKYTATRLEIDTVATVYLGVNETASVVEVQVPVLVLDNERTKSETIVSLNQGGFKVLEEYFVSTHGKKLDKIDIEKVDILCCREIPELEDEQVFVTIEESLDKNSQTDDNETYLYTMTLTDKMSDKYSSIRLSKEAYVALVQYCRR